MKYKRRSQTSEPNTREATSVMPAEKDVAVQILTEAVDALLRDEARVTERLQGHLRESSLYELLSQRNDAVSGNKSLAWWQKRGGLPTSMRFLEGLLRKGTQPIFGVVSLCLRSSAPTLYVPLPYGVDLGEDAIQRALLVPQEAIQASAGGREFSHAIANLAYSVRLNDDPRVGWLAEAHYTRRALYIADVDALGDSTTTAQDEERSLGMASVLYLPVVSEAIRPVQLARGAHASVLLMLWSPVPGRWDHLRAKQYKASRTVQTIKEAALQPKALADEFPWLGHELIKEDKTHAVSDAQFLGVIFALDRCLKDCNDSGREIRQRLMHGILDLNEALFTDAAVGGTRLKDWLQGRLSANAEPITTLKNGLGRSTDALPVELVTRRAGGRHSRTGTLGQIQHLIHLINADAHLGISEDLATAVLQEAASSIVAHGQALIGVVIDVSPLYSAVSFKFVPQRDARSRLHGSDTGFKQYFATRRGLIVPSERPGRLGLGLALYTRVPSRFGIYRRLYVSPDGEKWRVEVAVPLQPRDGAESHEEA